MSKKRCRVWRSRRHTGTQYFEKDIPQMQVLLDSSFFCYSHDYMEWAGARCTQAYCESIPAAYPTRPDQNLFLDLMLCTCLTLKLYGRMKRSAIPLPCTLMIHSSKSFGLVWAVAFATLASATPARHLIYKHRNLYSFPSTLCTKSLQMVRKAVHKAITVQEDVRAKYEFPSPQVQLGCRSHNGQRWLTLAQDKETVPRNMYWVRCISSCWRVSRYGV